MEIDWAVYGKNPGQHNDYGVLYASEHRITKIATFDRIIRSYTAGAPSGPQPGAADALPWITFIGFGIGGRPFMGVAIREWPGPNPPVDAFGRSIVGTRFFSLPFEDFRTRLGSFRALYDTVAGLRPERSKHPLRVPALPPESQFPEVDDLLAVDVAARLLDGPLSLVANQPPPPVDRIDLLDRVAELLPIGLRVGFSASTWADRGVGHNIRLAYTKRSDAEGEHLDLDAPPTPAEELTSIGARYVRNLRVSVRNAGLSAVRSWLLNTGTSTFGRAEAVPGELAAAAVEGVLADRPVDRDKARSLLVGLAPPADPTGRLTVVLLAAATRDDLPLIEENWVPALLPDFVRRCRELLVTDPDRPQGAALEDHVLLAERTGALGDVVATLLDSRRPDGSLDNADAELAARVIEYWRGARDGWADVEAILAENPALAVELAHRRMLPDAPRYLLPVLLQRLDDLGGAAVGPLLAPIWWILRYPDRAKPESGLRRLGSLPRLGERSVELLLGLADRYDRLEQLLPQLGDWLDDSGIGHDPARRAPWVARLAALDGTGRPKKLRKELTRLRERLSDGDDPERAPSDPEPGVRVRRLELFTPPVDDAPAVDWLAWRLRPRPGSTAIVAEGRWVAAVTREDAAIVDYSSVAGLGPAQVFDLVQRNESPAIADDDRAGWIDRIGFGWAAALAAAMLDGPVVVTVPSAFRSNLRLRVADAITGLLPAGCLASLRVTTSAPVAGGPLVRLAVVTDADAVDATSRVAQWGRPAQRLLGTELSSAYYHQLAGARAGRLDTARIAAALRRDPGAVDLSAAGEKHALIASCETWLRGSSPVDAGVTEAARDRAGAVCHGAPATAAAGGPLLDLWLSDRLGDRILASRYAFVLAASRQADRALAEVIEAARDDARRRAAAILVLRRLSSDSSTSPESLTAAHRAVLGHPAAAVEYLIQECWEAGADRAGRWLDALDSADLDGAHLRPFAETLRGAAVDDDALDVVGRHGDDALVALLHCAERGGRLPTLLERLPDAPRGVAAAFRDSLP